LIEPVDRRWSRVDWYIVAVMAVVAFLFATSFLPAYRAAGGTPFFYQQDYGPAVMLACGKGFVNPEVQSVPALQSFLERRADRFECEDLAPAQRAFSVNPLQSSSRYLLMVVALLWRTTRIEWAVLDVLSAASFAISIAAAYSALRFMSGTVVSLLVTVLWATSPWHILNLPHLRDYSKVPFFTLALLAIGLVLTARRPSTLIALGAAFGATQGFGYGMRADVAVNFVPFLIVLFAVVARSRHGYGVRLLCAAAAFATFVLVALPILNAYRAAGSLWHVTLLGLTTPFDVNLNLALPPPPYDFGYMYNDLYIETVVRSYWARLHPGGEAFRMLSPTYGLACPALYTSLAAAFPGDVLTRMVAAAINIVNFPFLPGYGHVPLGISNRPMVALYELRGSVMDMLEGFGPIAITIVLVILGMNGPRYAAVAFLLLCGVTAYPALQYQFRHMFHLELVVLAAIAVGGALLGRRLQDGWRHGDRDWLAEEGKRAGRSFIAVAGLFLVVAGTLFIGRAVQRPQAKALLQSYEAAALDPLGTKSEERPDGRLWLDAPVFSTPPPRDDLETMMVVAEFTPDRCGGTSSVDATFRYKQAHSGLDDFSRRVIVPLRPDTGIPTRVFFPAYAIFENGELMSRFAGLELESARADCVALSRVRSLTTLSLLLPATLTPGWEAGRLYQRLHLDLAVPWPVRRFFIRWWPSVIKRVPGWRRSA
jgi:hypothetical protein